MPRHATEDYARTVAGMATTGSGRVATESWVASFWDVTGATPGRLATDTFVTDAYAQTVQPDAWRFTSESSQLTDQWTTVVDTANQLALSTATTAVHEGSKGTVLTATTTTPAYVEKSGLNIGSDYTFEFWIKVGANWALEATWRDAAICSILDDTGELLRLALVGTGELRFDRLQPSYYRISNGVGSLSDDAWTKVGIWVAGGGTASGAYALLLNDVVVTEETGIDLTGRWAPTRVRLGALAVNGAVHTGNLYFDDGGFTVAGTNPTVPGTPGVPQNLTATVTTANEVALDWSDVTGFDAASGDRYRVFEEIQTPNGYIADVTVSNRTSATLDPGNYRYRVATVRNGVVGEKSSAAEVTITAPVSEPTGDDAATYTSFRTAYNSMNFATQEAWFLARVGPTVAISGTHPGGTIDTQTKADAMIGKRVTGDVLFKGAGLRVHDVEFLGRTVDYDWNVTDLVVEHCTINGNNQTYSAANHYMKGQVTFRFNRIRLTQDGAKTATSSDIFWEYCLVHQPSQQVGGLTGNATHQDALQVMGGKFVGRRNMLDYQGNHSGGQGMIVKGDSGPISRFEMTESIIRAGGNNLTFEATSNGYATVVELGSGDTMNIFWPASNMANVLSLYANPPSGYTLPQSFLNMVTGQSFRAGARGGAVINYANGLNAGAIS